MTTAKKTAPAKKTPGTAVAVKKSGAVVDIKAMQEELKRQAAAMSERTQPVTGNKILCTNAKEFKLPDGTTASELDVVILNFVSTNKFYDRPYDQKNPSPPACFAIGLNPKALVPSDSSPLKQCDTCNVCPMNEFGSSGDGKACKNTRLLAVLPPDADEDAPIWLLEVSPTGLKSYDSYVTSISRTFGMPPIGVVTKVTFDQQLPYQSLRFSDPQPNENLAAHFARQDEAKDMLIQEPDVSQYQQTAPAGRGAARPAAKKVANARR